MKTTPSERFLPHQVTHLESTLERLESENLLDYESWELRYVLLLWLSMLVLLPFDFKVIDVEKVGNFGVLPTHKLNSFLFLMKERCQIGR